MVDAAFYTDVWRGELTDTEEIERLLSRAEDVVNTAIFPTGLTVDTVPERIKTAVYKAVCAQADYIDGLGGVSAMSDEAMSSVTLGRFSYSGSGDGWIGSAGCSAVSLCAQARGLLLPTGLLFRGVRII